MNKFLGEQLLEFNKESSDQYRENWGSILNFVHEDPKPAVVSPTASDSNKNSIKRNNSGIDIFQRQMLMKEQQLLQEKAKQDAAKKHSNGQAQAVKYHQDEKQRIQELVKDVTKNPDGMSMYALSQIQYTHLSNKPGGAPSEQALNLSHQISNQSIDLDRSIQDISLQQQVSVSFQAVDSTPMVNGNGLHNNGQSKNTVRNKNSSQLDQVEEYMPNSPKSPQTPTLLGTQMLDQINKNIEEMDVGEIVTRTKELKSIVKRSSQQRKPEPANSNLVQEYQIFEQNAAFSQAGRPSLGERSASSSQTGNKSPIGFKKHGNRRRRLTIQENKNQHHVNSQDSQQNQLWNTQKNKNFFANVQHQNERNNLQLGQVQLQRDMSPFSKSSAGYGVNYTHNHQYERNQQQSPKLTEEPINLSNLQSLNIRSKLQQRLQHFQEEQNTADMPDLDSNRMGSTQDSLFGGPTEAATGMHQTQHNYQSRQTRSGMSVNHFGRGQYAHPFDPRHRKAFKSQFLKRHGKDLAKSSYMQSMLKIQGDLVEQSGRQTNYFHRPKHSSFITHTNGANSSGLRSDLEKTKSQLMKSAQTASFGGLYSNANDPQADKWRKNGPSTRGNASRFGNHKMGNSTHSPNQIFIKEHDRSQYDLGQMNGKTQLQSFQLTKVSNSKPKTLDEPNYIYQNQRKVVVNMRGPDKTRSGSQKAYRTTQNWQKGAIVSRLNTSQFNYHDEGDNRPIETKESTFQRVDSFDELQSQQQNQNTYNPASSNLVHVPNQKNAFFASGFNMVDPTGGNLEHIYQAVKSQIVRGKSQNTEKYENKLFQSYDEGKIVVDRTNQILKRLPMQTPGQSVNRNKIKRIQQQARNKVAYAYKERYCGIYEEKKRTGQLKKDNSWEKFVNPTKMGLNNYMQHALNTEAGEQLKGAQDQEDEDEVRPSMASQVSQTSERGDASRSELPYDSTRQRKGPKTSFRNQLERFHYQFDQEKVQNITETQTFDRIQKANKKFDDVILRAKPEIKLYHLLGYSQTQYILLRQIQTWMQSHKYSDQKYKDNEKNVQFAKEFFAIIDDNDSGQASLIELAVPMIALGLSSDSSFIKKVMKAISPHKFGKKAKAKDPFEVNQLTLKEFVKIFKKDQISENATEMLCSRIIQRRQQEELNKRRALERKQKQLSLVKADNAVFTVLQTEAQSFSQGHDGSDEAPDAELLQMVAEQDISELEYNQDASARQTSKRADTHGKSIIVQRGSVLDQMTNPAEALKKLTQISINDMLAEVRNLWFSLDGDKGQLELDILPVSKLLVQLKVLQDVSSAQKYIQNTIQSKSTLLDYDDFNSIFCKGIFRHSIVSKATEIEQEMAQNPDANPEQKLEFKLKATKNQILTDEIRKGRIESADEQVEIVKRPILSELWQIFYKNVPREQRETYQQFFDRMQGLTNTIIRDPNQVELDAFSVKNMSGLPKPDQSAIAMVCQENAVMSRSPYEVETTQSKHLASPNRSFRMSTRRQSKFSQGGEGQTKGSFANSGRTSQNGGATSRSRDRGDQDGQHKSRHRTGTSQMATKPREARLDAKSQMSTNTAKMNRPDTQGNMSSHRTVASSSKQTEKDRHQKSTHSGVKFNDIDLAPYESRQKYHNLDLKLVEDPEQLMAQRKQRFESLRQLQGLMERTSTEKPLGSEFLEAIYKRKDEEKRVRMEQADKNNNR